MSDFVSPFPLPTEEDLCNFNVPEIILKVTYAIHFLKWTCSRSSSRLCLHSDTDAIKPSHIEYCWTFSRDGRDRHLYVLDLHTISIQLASKYDFISLCKVRDNYICHVQHDNDEYELSCNKKEICISRLLLTTILLARFYSTSKTKKD